MTLAEFMKKTADDYHSTPVQLARILREVELASEKGKYQIYLPEKINDDLDLSLRTRGFSVRRGDSFRTGEYLEINWA